MIGTNGERESEKSVLLAQLSDDDDIYISNKNLKTDNLLQILHFWELKTGLFCKKDQILLEST